MKNNNLLTVALPGRKNNEFCNKKRSKLFLSFTQTKPNCFVLKAHEVDNESVSKKICNFEVKSSKASKTRAKKRINRKKKSKNRMLGIGCETNNTRSLAPSLGDFCKQNYFPFIEMNIKSYKNNISFFNNHILSQFENIPMDQITEDMVIQLYIDMLAVKKLAVATANKLFVFLSNAYNLAIELKAIGGDFNPSTGAKSSIINKNV